MTRVEYAPGPGRVQAYSAALDDLVGQNVLELLRDVLRACRDDGELLDCIDLGAFGDSAATVNEPARLKGALRADRLPLPNPLNLFPHRAKERLVRGALADDISVPPGTPVRRRRSSPPVVSLPLAKRQPQLRMKAPDRVVRALLFADMKGFSKLSDEQLPAFTHHVLGALAAVLHRHEANVSYPNTWGDGPMYRMRRPAAATF